VIIHFPEAVYAAGPGKPGCWQRCVNLPADAIKGTAGAGDAFASGVLLGLHEEREISACLQLGVCAAASSLTDATCSNGVQAAQRCLELSGAFGWRELPK
jgi:sugar/nucleoside kinase (ribokinase family)